MLELRLHWVPSHGAAVNHSSATSLLAQPNTRPRAALPRPCQVPELQGVILRLISTFGGLQIHNIHFLRSRDLSCGSKHSPAGRVARAGVTSAVPSGTGHTGQAGSCPGEPHPVTRRATLGGLGGHKEPTAARWYQPLPTEHPVVPSGLSLGGGGDAERMEGPGPHVGAHRRSCSSAAPNSCVFSWCGFSFFFSFSSPGPAGSFVAALS